MKTKQLHQTIENTSKNNHIVQNQIQLPLIVWFLAVLVRVAPIIYQSIVHRPTFSISVSVVNTTRHTDIINR